MFHTLRTLTSKGSEHKTKQKLLSNVSGLPKIGLGSKQLEVLKVVGKTNREQLS